MQRRTLLHSVALLGTGSLAGCIADRQVGGEETTTVGSVEPKLTDTDFEVVSQGCGNRVDEATIEFEDDTVEIAGTISGSDACKTAELADATYDRDADELQVTVATTDREDAEACSQCIVEIEYRAAVTFTGGLPPNVVVNHEGAGESGEVATSSRGAGETTTE